MKNFRQTNFLPTGEKQAFEWLMELVQAADAKTLSSVPIENFLRGWFSIGFLYPGLHPDNATDHGSELSYHVQDHADVPIIDHRLIVPVYVESGWPVVLEPIATEAWRRYEMEEFSDEEFYCSEAIIAGMCDRNPALLKSVIQTEDDFG